MSTWESPTEIYITLDVIPSVGLQCGSPNLPGDMKGSHLTTENDVSDIFWQIFGKRFGFVTDLCD